MRNTVLENDSSDGCAACCTSDYILAQTTAATFKSTTHSSRRCHTATLALQYNCTTYVCALPQLEPQRLM